MSGYRIFGSLIIAAVLMASVAGCGRSSRVKSAASVPAMPDPSEIKHIRVNPPPAIKPPGVADAS